MNEGDNSFNSSEKPKDMFLTAMILTLKKISRQIFFEPSDLVAAVRLMRVLISDLDRKSRQELEKIYDRLTAFEENINLCSQREMEEIYANLMTYLHATYLRNLFSVNAGNNM